MPTSGATHGGPLMAGFRMAKSTLRPRLEKTEQVNIVQLARSVGCAVYVLGTVRRGAPCPSCGTHVAGHRGTQQTSGLPDLEIWLPARASQTPGRAELLKWETKSATGRLSDEQATYRDLCATSSVTWGCGTYAAFEAFCVSRGLVQAKWIPADRREDRTPS